MADSDQRRHWTTAGGGWLRARFALASRARRWAVTIALGALAAGALPGSAGAASVGVPQLGGTGVFGQVPSVPHAMGLVVRQQPALTANAVAAVSKAATALPASVDLTPHAAPVGEPGTRSARAPRGRPTTARLATGRTSRASPAAGWSRCTPIPSSSTARTPAPRSMRTCRSTNSRASTTRPTTRRATSTTSTGRPRRRRPTPRTGS